MFRTSDALVKYSSTSSKNGVLAGPISNKQSRNKLADALKFHPTNFNAKGICGKPLHTKEADESRSNSTQLFYHSRGEASRSKRSPRVQQNSRKNKKEELLTLSPLEEGKAQGIPSATTKMGLNRTASNDLQKTIIMSIQDVKLQRNKDQEQTSREMPQLEFKKPVYTGITEQMMFHAVSARDSKTLGKLLNKGNINAAMNFRNDQGMGLLHVAVNNGALKIAEYLLKHGASPHIQSMRLQTPLHLACLKCNLEIIKLLLLHQASFLTQDIEGNTPAHYLIKSSLNLSEKNLSKKIERLKILKALETKSDFQRALKITNNKGQLARKITDPSSKIMKKCTDAPLCLRNNKRPTSAQLTRPCFHKEKITLASHFPAANLNLPTQESTNDTEVFGAPTEIISDAFLSNTGSCELYVEEEPQAVKSEIVPVVQSLDRYTILKLLGKGSFGEVYLVEDKLTKVQYAMKVIQKAKVISQNLAKYVLAEKRVMSKTNHPFIVKLRAKT